LKYRAIMRRGLQWCIPLWLCALSLSAQATTLDSQVTVRIAAQPLESALLELAEQAAVQLVLDPQLVKSRSSPALTGKMSIRQALDRLLQNTGLVYRWSGAHTVTIAPPSGFRAASADGRSGGSDAGAGVGARADPAPAGGADSSQNGGLTMLQEVIVTAQKRAQRLIDVPESISALSGQELQQAGIHSILDLSYAVPSLVVDQTGGGYQRYFIRGVGNGNGVISLVGVYLDDADITNNGNTQLAINMTDLARVEVLEGPQGTLYGDGSAGGTIRYITNDPNLTTFSAYGDVSLYGTQFGTPSQVVSTVLNAPLLQDTLGLRIVGTYGDIGGWVDQPAAGRDNINNQDLRDVRVKALWRPATALAVKTMVEVHRSDGNGSEVSADGSYNLTLAVDPKLPTPFVSNFNLYNLVASYDLSSVNLLSSMTYFNSQTHGVLGLEYPVAFPPTPVFQFLNDPDIRQDSSFSEEIRATSRGSGPLHWVTGAFFKHEQLDYTTDYIESFGGPVIGSGSALDNEGSKSVSVFGDGSYAITDRFTVGAGARYFHDDRAEYDGILFRTGSFHSLDPRVYASYALSSDVHFYASVADGYRSGGFNGGYGVPESTFAPEKVRSYEIGNKMSLLDGRLSTDLALFFTRYGDYQIYVNTPNGIGELENGGTAHIKGVDWSTQWQATQHLSLAANGSVTTSRFVSIVPGEVTVQVGDWVDFTSEYTARATSIYTFNPVADIPVFVRVDYSQAGPEHLTDRGEGGPPIIVESDVIHMLDARIGLRWSVWTAALFATNLLHDNGNEDPGVGYGIGARPRPRTVGIEVTGSVP
jgi:iron complex outermembrane recepter protein